MEKAIKRGDEVSIKALFKDSNRLKKYYGKIFKVERVVIIPGAGCSFCKLEGIPNDLPIHILQPANIEIPINQ